jgi:hypothetical protein
MPCDWTCRRSVESAQGNVSSGRTPGLQGYLRRPEFGGKRPFPGETRRPGLRPPEVSEATKSNDRFGVTSGN